jgi:hypothetical protein
VALSSWRRRIRRFPCVRSNGPWGSHTNGLISPSQRRPPMQFIPQFRIGVFRKGFPHRESDGIVPRSAAFAAGCRLAFWSRTCDHIAPNEYRSCPRTMQQHTLVAVRRLPGVLRGDRLLWKFSDFQKARSGTWRDVGSFKNADLATNAAYPQSRLILLELPARPWSAIARQNYQRLSVPRLVNSLDCSACL